MLTQEQKDLLDEIEKLATELNLPSKYRRDWRWIKRHSCFFANSGSEKLERLLKMIKTMAILSHDCLMDYDDMDSR